MLGVEAHIGMDAAMRHPAFSGLRRSGEMTRVCSPKVTHRWRRRLSGVRLSGLAG
jgi:hypothetical protein